MNQPPSLSPACQQAQQLVGQGRAVEAYRLLDRAATDGDGTAAYVLGHWRMVGDVVRRDLGMSRDFFGRAAELGFTDAAAPYLALLANGAGGSGRHWAQAVAIVKQRAALDPLAQTQASLLDAMTLTAAGDPRELPALESLSTQPNVRIAKAFLTQAECAYLRDRATPLLQPAVIVHPVSGQMMTDPIRTSASAAFPFLLEDPVIHAVNRRIAAISGTRYEQGEPLQILRYRRGEEYKLHNDALPHTDNQRVMTLLVYLNTDFQGGATAFPAIDLAHRGGAGDAILFVNVDAAGRPDPASRHRGDPVTAGEKFILSKWIREKPLDLTGPPGRPL